MCVEKKILKTLCDSYITPPVFFLLYRVVVSLLSIISNQTLHANRNLGRARDLSTHKDSFSVVSYHIIWEKLQNECSNGGSNSNKEVNHYHKHVRGAGFAEIERSWIHHGSNGPSATKRQVKVRRKLVYKRQEMKYF